MIQGLPVFILFGPPGVGKGTQAAKLSEKYGFYVISTGNILRDEISKGTELGRTVKSIMDRGEYPSDDMIIGLVDRVMKELSHGQSNKIQGFIFDGVPRTEYQAETLQNMLEKSDQSIKAVFSIEVDDEALVNRLKGRFMCEKCGQIYHEHYHLPKVEGVCDRCGAHKFVRRPDDEEKTVRERLKVYYDRTASLIPFYEKKGNLYKINGMGSASEVFASIQNVLRNLGEKELS